jgi:hypothetical protein
MRNQTTGRATKLALPPAVALAFVLLAMSPAGRADNFRKVTYDPATDELVIVVVYRGTNPDHQFTLKWGSCVDRGSDQHEIVAELLDQQFQDLAQKDFKKTIRMSLANLQCRPASVTLRTAPRFYYTLTVPARAANAASP